jgi:hypothetical protein
MLAPHHFIFFSSEICAFFTERPFSKAGNKTRTHFASDSTNTIGGIVANV